MLEILFLILFLQQNLTCAAAAQFDIIFDAVGGQAVEDDARMAFEGRKGHFVTIIGPGADTFGEGTDGGFKNIANGISISARYRTKSIKLKIRIGKTHIFLCFFI